MYKLFSMEFLGKPSLAINEMDILHLVIVTSCFFWVGSGYWILVGLIWQSGSIWDKNLKTRVMALRFILAI